MFDLNGDGLVRVHSSQLDIRRVGHEKVAVEVDWADARRSTHSHDRVEGGSPLNVPFKILNEPFTIQVRLEVSVLVYLSKKKHIIQNTIGDYSILNNTW